MDCFASLAMTVVDCHSGAMRSIEPGISRFRVWSFGPSRNDDGDFSTPRLQRLVDLGLQHAVDIVRRHRADQLEDDSALAADDERLRHAVDAPFDRGAAVAVDADEAERVAVA